MRFGDYASIQEFHRLEADLQEAREVLQMFMEWIGPPPAGPYEFDSLREDAWAKARAFLSRTAPREKGEKSEQEDSPEM